LTLTTVTECLSQLTLLYYPNLKPTSLFSFFKNNNLLKVKGAPKYTSNIHKTLQNEQKTQTLQPKTQT